MTPIRPNGIFNTLDEHSFRTRLIHILEFSCCEGSLGVGRVYVKIFAILNFAGILMSTLTAKFKKCLYDTLALCENLLSLRSGMGFPSWLANKESLTFVFPLSRIQYGSDEGRHSIWDFVELRPKLGRWWRLKHLLLYTSIWCSTMVAGKP